MSYKNINKIMLIFIFCFILNVGYASAQEEYRDDFSIKTLDLSSWTALTSETWEIINGTVSSTGTRPGLIFEKWSGEKYISEVDFTANKTRILDYAQVGFYFYYEDSDNYIRVVFGDDDRKDKKDYLRMAQKGPSFINTRTYINTSVNTSIEFDPNVMHHLKVVRLNKKIYVYFDDRLALTTEFKDENPSGKVGFDVYESTGFFDNFYLHPISMKNASGYIDKLKLNSSNPSTRLGLYSLRLVDVSSEGAFFTLSKFGKVVDTVIASEGDRVSMSFENGEEGVEFRVRTAFSGDKESMVELEELIYAEPESLTPHIENLSIKPYYYQGEFMRVNFSVVNPSFRFRATPEITINSEGDRVTVNPELDLDTNESENFSAQLKAAKTLGEHKLTITMKLDEYNIVTQSKEYQVRAFNPVVTELSPDLREENGIRGTATIGSAYSDELVDWNTTASVEIFRVLENGKELAYHKEIPVKSRSFSISIPYNKFYSEDGRYLVSISIGEMKNDRFFEIKGPDGEYNPSKAEKLPPTVVSNSLYPQLMLLLIGMVAALSVRNHMHPRRWSLPLDYVVIASGAVLFGTGLWQGNSDITTKGMLTAGVGIMLVYAREHDERIDKLLLRGTPIHDFAGLIVIFLTASYLVLLIPGWNTMVIAGTLIVYYMVINLHGERKIE